jgi:SpoVK/Ycf46/Vps4 family AAA+-type ATPase
LSSNGATTTLPQGISSVQILPGPHDHGGESDWDRIILPDGVKQRLKNQALLTLLHREQLRELGLAPQGLVVFAGPPGTGKTTLARGLAFEVAHELAPSRGNSTFIEIDPHSLPSEMLGESQRSVMRLLTKTIPEYAQRRSTTIVLVDEVEAFAVSRSAASFETNPVDLHRATDAVLMGLDQIAAQCPGTLFLTTTNFIEAIDEAMLSRADMIVPFRRATAEVAAEILRRALDALAAAWPPIAELARDTAELARLGEALAGWDGRRLTKLPVVAMAQRLETVQNPAAMTFADLWAAVEELRPDRFARSGEQTNVRAVS